MMSDKNLLPPNDHDAQDDEFAPEPLPYAAGNPLEPPLYAVPESDIDTAVFNEGTFDEMDDAADEYALGDAVSDEAADRLDNGGDAYAGASSDEDDSAVDDTGADDADDVTAPSSEYDGALSYAAWAETLETPAVDLDALLASVSSYAVELDEEETPRTRDSRSSDDAAPFTPIPYTPALALPPLTTLRRGSLGSLVPALCLIALGAWMTLTLTSGGVLDTRLVLAAIIGSIFISLLAHWLGTRRWARGGLFFALCILGAAALLAVSLQTGGLDLLRAYPLLLGAVGIGLVGAGLLGRPRLSRALFPGLLLLVGAGAGVAYTLGLLPAALVVPALPFWPVLAALIGLLFALPLVFARPSPSRRRGRR